MQAESGGGAEPRKNIHGFGGGPDAILLVVLLTKIYSIIEQRDCSPYPITYRHSSSVLRFYSRSLAVDRDRFQDLKRGERHRYSDTALQPLTKEKFNGRDFSHTAPIKYMFPARCGQRHIAQISFLSKLYLLVISGVEPVFTLLV